MNYRRMGRSGLKISEIALGAWVTFGDQIEEKTATDLVHLAYEQGVNYFDNADVYAKGRAEQVMGKAIKDLPRESLVISSKVFWKRRRSVGSASCTKPKPCASFWRNGRKLSWPT